MFFIIDLVDALWTVFSVKISLKKGRLKRFIDLCLTWIKSVPSFTKRLYNKLYYAIWYHKNNIKIPKKNIFSLIFSIPQMCLVVCMVMMFKVNHIKIIFLYISKRFNKYSKRKLLNPICKMSFERDKSDEKTYK